MVKSILRLNYRIKRLSPGTRKIQPIISLGSNAQNIDTNTYFSAVAPNWIKKNKLTSEKYIIAKIKVGLFLLNFFFFGGGEGDFRKKTVLYTSEVQFWTALPNKFLAYLKSSLSSRALFTLCAQRCDLKLVKI